MIVFLVLLVCAFLLLLCRHLLLKKKIRSLARQMKELSDGISEKALDIALIDRDLEYLASTLNQYNTKQRTYVATAMRHEEHLKESIANVSHDLRTPLTVILGHLQILQKSDLTEEQSKHILAAYRKAERMNELIGAFYDLSIWDSKQITPQKESVNISNLLIDLITENAPLLERKNILPEIAMPDYSVKIISDRGMIERIFQNLITNAIRYTAEPAIKIALSKMEQGVGIKVENRVQDEKQFDIDRLFERFYTGDQARHNGNSGLGLAVVKLLVDKLNGQVIATRSANILSIAVILPTNITDGGETLEQ